MARSTIHSYGGLPAHPALSESDLCSATKIVCSVGTVPHGWRGLTLSRSGTTTDGQQSMFLSQRAGIVNHLSGAMYNLQSKVKTRAAQPGSLRNKLVHDTTTKYVDDQCAIINVTVRWRDGPKVNERSDALERDHGSDSQQISPTSPRRDGSYEPCADEGPWLADWIENGYR
jgi:hypothetical protein